MADIEDRKTGLPSFTSNTRAVIGCLVASPLAAYFYHRGDSGRALISLVAGACLIFLISARWNLRRFIWFWISIAITVAINISMIFLIPWPGAGGVRGPVLAPLGALLGGFDYLLIWIAMKIMGAQASKKPIDEDMTGR